MSSPEETLPLPAKQPAADPESGYLPKVLSMVDEVLARYSRTTTEILTTPTGQPFHGDNGRQEARASRAKVKLLLKEVERSKRQTPSTRSMSCIGDKARNTAGRLRQNTSGEKSG
jgi:hypothetical protein